MTSSPHPLHDGSLDPLTLLHRHGGDGNDLRGIRLRLLWLRQQHPEARVRTKLVLRDDRTVVISARVALPNGGEGAGHAASPIREATDFAEALEAAELQAIGRALDMLGYIVVDRHNDASPATPDTAPATPPTIDRQFAAVDTAPAGPTLEEQPHRRPPDHVQAIRALRDRHGTPPAEASPAPTVGKPAPLAQDQAPTPVPMPQREHSSSPTREQAGDTSPQAAPSPPTDSPDAEPELEDISWTAFWTWARNTHQIGSRVQVEELLGQPVARKTPGELRQLLNAHFAGPNPADS